MEIVIGYDPRERVAWDVCARSILRHAKTPPSIRPIGIRTLGEEYARPTEVRDGRLWDVISEAPMSTEFALARFFVPLDSRDRLVLFCDCDFLFRADPHELVEHFDPKFAVQVVKHAQEGGGEKMDGQVQTSYPRKNWSSLVLWNMHHAGNRRFWHGDVNRNPGLWLQQFGWLKDHEIGDLPAEWNHLVGVNPPNADAKGVHMTLGIPAMPGYENCEFADEWRSYT